VGAVSHWGKGHGAQIMPLTVSRWITDRKRAASRATFQVLEIAKGMPSRDAPYGYPKSSLRRSDEFNDRAIGQHRNAGL
jgi:hypothetical protein